MNMRTLVILVCVVFSVSGRAQDAEQSPREAFDQAVSLFEAGDHEAAIPLLQSALQAYPDATGALWNLGISALLTERYDLAAITWKHYREIAPQDWKALSKLIQAYQGSGNMERRDYVRNELIKLYESDTDSSLSNEDRYCREQYRIEDGSVLVHEYFQPFSSATAKIYEFFFTDAQGDTRFSVSFGSYDFTNTLDLELGNHGPDERLYHFDAYYPDGTHRTLGFVTRSEVMNYDEARTIMAPMVERLSKETP